MRRNVDVSAYLVVGPENTKGRPVSEMIKAAVDSGYTCIQIRSKTASAMEMIELTCEASHIIENAGRQDDVTLLVDDRLDVILAARKRGAKVDGIHVGQSDIPVDVCREYLGEDSVIGLSARTHELFDYIRTVDVKDIDYFGAGPLHETETKKDCGLGSDGKVVTRGFDELKELAELSPIPVVVGGGVKLNDIPDLAQTGVDGFFVVSAITEADDPRSEAKKLIDAWNVNRTPRKR